MKAIWLLPATLFLPSLALSAPPALPLPAQRAAMIEALSAEMQRLDGEGLIVRERNRRLSFGEVTSQLAAEARAAESWERLLRAFARLDSAYPNLHARLSPPDWLRLKRLRPKAHFAGEWLASGTRFVVVNSAGHANEGDLLVAINGVSMAEWSAENLEFCKWPLREQCDLELYQNFRKQLLSWTADQPLTYTLERNGRRFDASVELEEMAPPGPEEDKECGADEKLYPGFTLAHRGRYACLFTKDGDASTVLFRISSFWYDDESNHAIRSVQDEVEALWPWWRARAPRIAHLILDLAGNHGGNQPTSYYEILFDRPYQEQWVRFKKIPELLNEPLRKQTLFCGTPQQETWFQNLRREGVWDGTPMGEFLPAVPMFCAGDESSDCREGLFPVRHHGFRGRVTLLLNHWCVSSCDGFAFEVKEQLGARVKVAGQPQAADTAYSRATIQLWLDPASRDGFRLAIEGPEEKKGSQPLLRQSVAVTRSVLEDGSVVSGVPLVMDQFLDWPYTMTERDWRAKASQGLR